MSERKFCRMESETAIRHGHMALVVRIGNMLEKAREQYTDVAQYLETIADQWTFFVLGELKESNEKNNMVLG